MKVWILRTLTTMSGSVLSSGLDLSCLLVSWNKQIFGHLAVSWTRKQATHPQLSWEKAWEQQQFLEIEKAVLRYWCQSPSCLSKSESAAAVLFILSIYLKILGQPFLGWKLQKTPNQTYLKYTRLAQKTKGKTVKISTEVSSLFIMLSNEDLTQLITWLTCFEKVITWTAVSLIGRFGGNQQIWGP